MKIKAIAPWFGAKRLLAPRIVREIGQHKCYFELCSGSLAVLMAKPVVPMETVVDLHGDVVNLAMVLASDRWRELHARLERTLMCDKLFAHSKSICCGAPCTPPDSPEGVDDQHVDRAYYAMIQCWQGRNGSSGTIAGNQQVATRYTSNGGSGGFRWLSAVESLPAWHERLRPVHIKCLDVMTLTEKIEDKISTALYCDPPYIRKGSKYVHDFDQECSIEEALADGDGEKDGKRNDHVRLACRLRRFQETRVVLSYYDEPELELLYPGWTIIKVPINKGLVNQGQRGGAETVTEAPEVLLINGPSFTKERRLFD